jgi:hypothetical protein
MRTLSERIANGMLFVFVFVFVSPDAYQGGKFLGEYLCSVGIAFPHASAKSVRL